MPPTQGQLEAWIIKRSYEVGFSDNGTFVGKKLLLQKLLRDRFKYGFASFPEEEIKLAFAKLCTLGLAMRLNDEGATRARDKRDQCNSESGNGAPNGTTPGTTPSSTPAPPPPKGRDVPPEPTAPKRSFATQLINHRPLYDS